ncbi:MAG: hypothetical protein GEV12_19010 [Micromonosporaceae bacterium]|nr:hypothetical protein [Micromonosporaceae bacterium]
MTDDRRATRDTSRVALVTCADLPELDPDDRLLAAALRGLGVEPVAAVWDDPAVDWSGFDLAVLRSPWDYPARRAEFLGWAATVPALANPVDVVTWNTDKRYLVELDLAGLPVVPTSWLAADDRWQPPQTGEWVVKPAVGVGSKSCGRYRLADPVHRRLAGSHVARLQHAGQLVMVQPYQPAVDRYGETAVLFLAGPGRDGLLYSHAVRKGPMLAGPDRPSPELFRPEQITDRVPSAAELALARRVLAEVPGGPDRLLYARVDLIPGVDGRPQLVEVELTEPSLFLGYEPGAAARLAAAIAARLRPGQGGRAGPLGPRSRPAP